MRARASATLMAGLIAAGLFLAIASYRLDQAGAYYDELHQATGSFAYIGRPTSMFSFVPVFGVPLLNMSYTGAIKTAIYGLYLRFSGRPFSLFSWRLLGVLFTAIGIVCFSVLARERLRLAAAVLFFALLLTDLNLLLQSRHDWGPVALSFLLRMVLLGVALRDLGREADARSPFAWGLIVGVAIFEKLSSTVLLGPLAVLLWADERLRPKRLATAFAGFVVGASPAIVVNMYSLATTGKLLALSSADPTPRRTLVGYASNFLFLGSGGIERAMIFDLPSPHGIEPLEGAAMLGLLVVAAIVWWRRDRDDLNARLAGVALACYATVGIALPFLPHGTAEHHWIVGTPFQYLAVALAAASLWGSPPKARTALRIAFAACLVALAGARAPVLASTIEAVRSGHYSRTWDPSLNTAARFIAQQPETTTFVAASWGIGTQVFCFSNGRQDFVFEPFWNYGWPGPRLTPALSVPNRTAVVAAALRPAEPLKPGQINTVLQVTRDIFEDLSNDPNLEEVPVPPEITSLRSVEVRAFRRLQPR